MPRVPFLGLAHRAPARVYGPIGEHYFTPRDAVAAVVADPITGGTALVVLISNRPDTCEKIAAGTQPRDAEGFSFALARIPKGGKASAAADPGAFRIVAPGTSEARGGIASASYKRVEQCEQVSAYEGASGTVTLKELGFDRIAGEFDVVFAGDGGRVAGAFEASQCDALLTAVAPACR
jgi:hypothetical protein